MPHLSTPSHSAAHVQLRKEDRTKPLSQSSNAILSSSAPRSILGTPHHGGFGGKGGKGPRSGSRTSCILRSFPAPAMRSGPQLCIHQHTNTNNGKQASSSIHACLLGYPTNTSKIVPEQLIEIVKMTCRTHSGQGSAPSRLCWYATTLAPIATSRKTMQWYASAEGALPL